MPAGAALLLISCLCHADVEERITACAASATSAQRVACLEQALRELAAGGQVAERGAAPADVVQPKPELPEPGVAPPVTADPESVQTRDSAAGNAGPGVQDASVARQPETRDDAGSVAVELGTEQVAARSGDREEPSIVQATVVDFRFVGYRRLLVQLDNGQVWRQIDGDRTSVDRGLRNAESFDVEMWGTTLGGYRMRILPLERTIRVERLR